MAALLEVAAVLDTALLQGLLYASLALSLLFTFIALDYPDLTVEGSFPLGGAVAASLIAFVGVPPALATAFAVIAGAVFGVVTAVLHLRFRISKLLSGIIVAAALYSVCLVVMSNRANVSLLNEQTLFSWFQSLDLDLNRRLLAGRNFYFHPTSILFALFLVLVVKWICDRFLATEVGIALRGVGHNPAGVRALGFSIRRLTFIGLAVANGLVGFSGALVVQSQGFADVTLGVGVLVLALASLVVGLEGASRLGLESGSIAGMSRAAILGMIAYQAVVATVMRLGVPPSLLRLVTAMLLIAALAMRHRQGEIAFRW